MITGLVTAGREAVVSLRLRGTNGVEVDVKATMDIGFTESLTLSQTLINSLALPLVEINRLFLADGSMLTIPVHEVVVVWDGRDRLVAAHCVQGKPLIGMSLLMDHLLTVEVVVGGPVSIASLP